MWCLGGVRQPGLLVHHSQWCCPLEKGTTNTQQPLVASPLCGATSKRGWNHGSPGMTLGPWPRPIFVLMHLKAGWHLSDCADSWGWSLAAWDTALLPWGFGRCSLLRHAETRSSKKAHWFTVEINSAGHQNSSNIALSAFVFQRHWMESILPSVMCSPSHEASSLFADRWRQLRWQQMGDVPAGMGTCTTTQLSSMDISELCL